MLHLKDSYASRRLAHYTFKNVSEEDARELVRKAEEFVKGVEAKAFRDRSLNL